MKTIGIIGSRRRDTEEDFKQCEEAFIKVYQDGDHLVSGGCSRGGDRFCEILAKKYQVPIKIYYAKWDTLGKGAGFARNTDIARDSNVLIALVAEDRTGGAEDTIRKAERMGGKQIILLEKPTQDATDDAEGLDLSI